MSKTDSVSEDAVTRVKASPTFPELKKFVQTHRSSRGTLDMKHSPMKLLRLLVAVCNEAGFPSFASISAALGTRPQGGQYVAHSSLSELFRRGVEKNKVIYYREFEGHWPAAALIRRDLNAAELARAVGRQSARPGLRSTRKPDKQPDKEFLPHLAPTPPAVEAALTEEPAKPRIRRKKAEPEDPAQLHLPNVSVTPPAPQAAPAPTAAPAVHAPVIVALILDLTGAPTAEITGDLSGLTPTVLWCTDASGAVRRLRVVAPA